MGARAAATAGRGLLEWLAGRPVHRSLLLVAHPEDAIMGAGIALAGFPQVLVLHASDGVAADPLEVQWAGFATAAELAAARLAEARAALALQGLSPDALQGLGFAAHQLAGRPPELAQAIQQHLQVHRPDVLITHSGQPDQPHQAAVAGAARLACQELLQAGQPVPLLVEMGATEAPAQVQDREGILRLDHSDQAHKRRLLACFLSQRDRLLGAPRQLEHFRCVPINAATIAGSTPSRFDRSKADRASTCYFSSKRRILILGSSVSIQKNGYLKHLTDALDELSPEPHEVLNASLGGTPSEATYGYVSTNFLFDIQGFRPDVCLIEKAPNDKILDRKNISESELQDRLARIEKYLLALVQFLQAMGCRVILASMYQRPDENLNQIPGHPLDYLTPLYDKIAQMMGSSHINIAGILSTSFSAEDLSALLLDDVHLSPLGAERVASLLLKQTLELRLEANEPELCSGSLACESDLQRKSHLIRLFPIFTGRQESFKSSLINVDYDTLLSGKPHQILASHSGYLNGIYYINDANSCWIRISTDRGKSAKLNLFDFYSFMPRLDYRALPALAFNKAITIEILNDPIDHNIALKEYKRSKTFDPTSNWAQKKYLSPLLEAMQGCSCRCFKPVVLLAGETGDLT